MFKTLEPSRNEPADTIAGSRVFSRLEELIAYYAQLVPGRDAILAPGRRTLGRLSGAAWRQCVTRILKSAVCSTPQRRSHSSR